MTNITKVFNIVHKDEAQTCIDIVETRFNEWLDKGKPDDEMFSEINLKNDKYLDEDALEEKSQDIMKERLNNAGFNVDESIKLSQYPYESIDKELQYKFITYMLQCYMEETGNYEYTSNNIINTLAEYGCYYNDITKEDVKKFKTYDNIINYWN